MTMLKIHQGVLVQPECLLMRQSYLLHLKQLRGKIVETNQAKYILIKVLYGSTTYLFP